MKYLVIAIVLLTANVFRLPAINLERVQVDTEMKAENFNIVEFFVPTTMLPGQIPVFKSDIPVWYSTADGGCDIAQPKDNYCTTPIHTVSYHHEVEAEAVKGFNLEIYRRGARLLYEAGSKNILLDKASKEDIIRKFGVEEKHVRFFNYGNGNKQFLIGVRIDRPTIAAIAQGIPHTVAVKGGFTSTGHVSLVVLNKADIIVSKIK